MSIVEINTSTKNNKEFLKVHVVTSVYGKRSIDNYVKKAFEDGRLIDMKKETISQGISQVQYKGDINDMVSTDSIHQTTIESQQKNSERESDLIEFFAAIYENADYIEEE